VTELVDSGPSSQAAGAVRATPTPRIANAAATFNGVYMRPNPTSEGTVPAEGTLCTSPDIWIAGTEPVNNFQTALATSESYGKESGNEVQEGRNNYIYLRAKNGTSVAQTKTIQVYYAPSGVIQWPSDWEPNVIPTDEGKEFAQIANLAPGAIGVGNEVFVWQNVQPPPPGSDHYCLIAQVNDAQNTNPPPKVDTLLNLGELIQSNLEFGWRNTRLVSRGQPSFQFTQRLKIKDNIPARENYTISVAPVGWIGFYVSFTCSKVDANGNKIELAPTKIVQDGAGLAAPVCPLEPGYEAELNVIVTNNDGVSGPQPKAKVPLSIHYTPAASSADAAEIVRRGLVDWRFLCSLRRNQHEEPIEPTVALALGSFTWIAV
jgi:hypothetical protein